MLERSNYEIAMLVKRLEEVKQATKRNEAEYDQTMNLIHMMQKEAEKLVRFHDQLNEERRIIMTQLDELNKTGY